MTPTPATSTLSVSDRTTRNMEVNQSSRFLSLSPNSLKELSISSLKVDISELDINNACTIFDINPQEFFMACYTLTLQSYEGSTFSIRINNVHHQCDTKLEVNIPDTDLDGFFKLLRNQAKLSEDNDDLEPRFMFSFNDESEKKRNIPLAALSLEVCEDKNGNGRFVILSWCKQLLNESIANNFLNNFIICCQLVAMKTLNFPIQALDILSKEEKSMLYEFENRDFISTPIKREYSSLIAEFDHNVNLNPSKIAIHDSSNQFTYAQLQTASNQIAVELLTRFPYLANNPIVLVMEKNFQCVASVLGVWRAGGHFIPVDSNMQEKIQGESQINALCVLTNVAPSELKQELFSWPIIEVDEILKIQKNIPLLDKIIPEDKTPAYLTMTSGSTGKPKKCLNSFGGLYHFMVSSADQFQLSENINLAQWVPFSFDVFIGDVIKSLFSVNGSLTMISQADRFNIPRLSLQMKKKEVNFIHITPKFAAFALQELPTFFQGIQTIVLGGENLDWKTLDLIEKHVGSSTKLYNCYGLTEATVESTIFQIPPNAREEYEGACDFVPIGVPYPGIKIRVLDPEYLRAVPIGVTGRLAISGPTLGSGDIKTHEIDGEQTLITGDSVSWLPNGMLKFVGRDETQTIKLRGMRINCPYLENQIAKASSKIQSAIVMIIGNGDEVILIAAVESLSVDTGSLLETLRKSMPYYMVPQMIFPFATFPLTENGKVDRRALKSEINLMHKQNLGLKQYSSNGMTEMEEFLVHKLSDCSSRPSESISLDVNLYDQGFTSLQLMRFCNLLMNKEIPGFNGITDLFAYPSIRQLAGKLETPILSHTATLGEQIFPKIQSDPICIVGMSFRLPGNISTIPAFWKALSSGTCFVTDFPPNRSEDVLTRMTTPFKSPAVRASFFPAIDQFDHEFFKIAQNEARHMCPEQRMFLEIATEAMDDSGMDLANIEGANIGIYCTATDIEYGIIDSSLDGVAVVGRQSSVVPSRVTYTYNLKGGNYVVDTACSAALVALEQAVRDLRAGQCESAIVGGVNIYLYPAADGLMGTNLIHSSSSQCLAFDDEADGTVSGEGCFAYVLKRQSSAKRDGDHIYGTIESCCSNAVGRGNGITAPSVHSQVEVIQEAVNQAGLSINDVDFLETHGTGTVLGDQIELCALSSVFNSRNSPLVIGASKPNFGHLDMAAGFLSILKATTALTLNETPSLKHIKKPSKYLDSDLFVTEAKEIKSGESKSYAGVSAYGLSGTNCHAIIGYEKPQVFYPIMGDGEYCNFILQMESNLRVNLEDQCKMYAEYIEFYSSKGLTLADVCGTQISNLIHSGKKSQKVAILMKSSLPDLMKHLEVIGNGVSIIGTDRIKTLAIDELPSFLPKRYSRAPAFPKFIFKNFRHWLPPVEQIQPTLELPKLEEMMLNKMSECHAILEAAHNLEKLLNQFSFGVMSDLLNKKGGMQLPQNPNATLLSEIPKVSPPTLESQQKLQHENQTMESYSTKDPSFISIYQMIMEIWKDCLGCEDINELSIFRDLGGDSLLTVQMSKLVSKKFGVKIIAADAFSNPSLSSFSAFVFNKLSSSDQIKLGFKLVDKMPLKMILFPGQGSQKVNMCSSLLSCPPGKALIEQASELTGIDIISQLSNPKSFENTEFVQICLFVGSLAKLEQIKKEDPQLLAGIRAVAGLSAGEFSALVFAQAIEFKDALKIVQFRGKAMQASIDSEKKTGMVSIFGPEKQVLKEWLQKNFPDVRFSTLLGDNQFAVGGPLNSCQRLVEQLLEAEHLGVIDVRLLRVAGAFHTEYMKEAGQKTAAMIDSLDIKFPIYGIVMNYDGQMAMTKESIRFNLKKQTSSPVLWRESMVTAFGIGIREFIEISPSSVLTPILKSRIKDVRDCKVDLHRF